MNKYIVEFANADSIIYESKHVSEDKVFYELTAKRFIIHEGMLYNTSLISKIGKV